MLRAKRGAFVSRRRPGVVLEGVGRMADARDQVWSSSSSSDIIAAQILAAALGGVGCFEVQKVGKEGRSGAKKREREQAKGRKEAPRQSTQEEAVECGGGQGVFSVGGTGTRH